MLSFLKFHIILVLDRLRCGAQHGNLSSFNNIGSICTDSLRHGNG